MCVIEYGHPCVAAAQSELLVREARREGHAVHVLPGVSAVDALWADLGAAGQTSQRRKPVERV